jgi:uncharacterized membrane protein
MEVKKSITVNRAPEEVYQFWHNFENLPRFMEHVEAVQVTGNGRSHWKVKAPAGRTVEWDAEVTTDQPNEVIAWRSLPGADISNAGTVRFERGPAGRGTVIRVTMEYDAPGGEVGKLVAKLFGEEPEQQVSGDLRRFKQVIETGELTKSDASLRGKGPAQPPEARTK